MNAADRFAAAPIAQLVGFQIEPGEPGVCVVKLHADERLHNPMGRVHGGVIAALADAAMGTAFGRTLLDGQDFATIDMQVQFVRPVTEGQLTATARVTDRGLRIGFVECTILNTRRRVIAHARCSCTIVDL
jgi:uncharacterized protein (TIGR00369 family)